MARNPERAFEAEDRSRRQDAARLLTGEPSLRWWLRQVQKAAGTAEIGKDTLSTYHSLGKLALVREVFGELELTHPGLTGQLLTEQALEDDTRAKQLARGNPGDGDPSDD